jgi:hypothetical protein
MEWVPQPNHEAEQIEWCGPTHHAKLSSALPNNFLIVRNPWITGSGSIEWTPRLHPERTGSG